MTKEEEEEHQAEYEELLALYIALLQAWNNGDREGALYNLAELRTAQAFSYVVKGLGIGLNLAETLLKNMGDNSLSQRDKEMRDRLSAAIDNLIDFCVCEEYQLYEELIDAVENGEDIDLENIEPLLAINRKYNDYRAAVENADIAYAGMIAAFWISLSSRDYIVYWTQNDAKVRPSHMELQGYAAPKDEFPAWMIPPIEYNCRCFLERLEYGSTIGEMGNIKDAMVIKKPESISDVYSESLAKCGRIFGPSHDYFNIKTEDKAMLDRFVERLREKYYG